MSRFYFDFLSPYSYLAVRSLDRFPELADATPIPVALGSILSHYGALGPGEIPARRRAGLRDVLLVASAGDIPLKGPPKHPFNSVPALRIAGALDGEVRKQFVRWAFDASWAEGLDISDFGVLGDCLAQAGATGMDPEDVATSRDRRAGLKEDTRAFLDAGGVGVPSFEVSGTLFFGQDRMELASRYARGEADYDRDQLERLLGRPQPARIV